MAAGLKTTSCYVDDHRFGGRGAVLGGADKVIKTNTPKDDWTDNGGVCADSKCLECLHEP